MRDVVLFAILASHHLRSDVVLICCACLVASHFQELGLEVGAASADFAKGVLESGVAKFKIDC